MISTLTLVRDSPWDRMAHYLQQLSIFSDFPAEFFRSLGRTMTIQHYECGDFIVKKGMCTAALYYLNKGSASAVSVDGSTIFTKQTEATFFGEASLLFALPATKSVRCDERCEVNSTRFEL